MNQVRVVRGGSFVGPCDGSESFHPACRDCPIVLRESEGDKVVYGEMLLWLESRNMAELETILQVGNMCSRRIEICQMILGRMRQWIHCLQPGELFEVVGEATPLVHHLQVFEEKYPGRMN